MFGFEGGKRKGTADAEAREFRRDTPVRGVEHNPGKPVQPDAPLVTGIAAGENAFALKKNAWNDTMGMGQVERPPVKTAKETEPVKENTNNAEKVARLAVLQKKIDGLRGHWSLSDEHLAEMKGYIDEAAQIMEELHKDSEEGGVEEKAA